MFNDEIMLAYIVLAMYNLSKRRPYWCLFFFSLAYGVKAGALLMIPAMLGSIQMNHGPVKLLVSLAFMILFQIGLALPFLLGNTSIADYIERSKLTGAGRNGVQSSAHFWDYLAAHHGLTILWNFVDEKCYFDKSCLSDKVKVGMLLANIWFFFVRKNCIPQCLKNLVELKGRQVSKRLTIELLVIQYMCGCVLMPGANGQFVFWYMMFVPLLTAMIGVPAWATCFLYIYLFPIEGDPAFQHKLLLGVCTYLVTVGP